MTANQAKKATPKFHVGDYMASKEMEEEELSDDEDDMDINGLFDSDKEDEEEAMRSDLRERQAMAKKQMERDAADELRVFHENLAAEKQKKMEAAILESHRLSRAYAEAERSDDPHKFGSTEASRAKMYQEKEELKTKRDLELDEALDSEEERVVNERNDHLEYVARVRFDQECKFQKEDDDAAAALAQQKQQAAQVAKEQEESIQQQKQKDEEVQQMKQQAEDELASQVKQAQDEVEAKEALERRKKEHRMDIQRENIIRQQAREQDQIDLEYEEQQREQKNRIASVREKILQPDLKKCNQKRKKKWKIDSHLVE